MVDVYVYVVSGVKWAGKEFRSKAIRIKSFAYSRSDARKLKKAFKNDGYRTYFVRYAYDSMNDKGR